MAARKGASPASSFKRKGKQVTELPSGLFVMMRRPGMEKFLASGYMPDKMAAIIREQINSKSTKPTRPEDILGDEGMSMDDVTEMMHAMDRITAYCITEPVVFWHMRPVVEDDKPVLDDKGRNKLEEIPEEDRDEEIVYTDDIDLEDKQFVFQYAVGGTPDLTRFREQSASVVAALQPSGDVALPTQ